MAIIATLTFSPCIDKTASVEKLIPDKKLKCTGVESYPGGGGINIARAAVLLKSSATAIYPSGGYTGKQLTTLLNNEGVEQVAVRADNETRENLIIREEATGLQYRFGMPASPLSPNTCREMIVCLEEIDRVNYIVVSGVVPEGVGTDIFSVLTSLARKKNARLLIDTSGPFLLHAVKAAPFLVKPNLGELASLVNAGWLEEEEIVKAATDVMNQFACENIVVSMGEKGAMLVNDAGHWRFTPPKVDKQGTVGAGDSMMAGIIVSLSHNNTITEAVKFGVACGTAATLRHGTKLCSHDDVMRLYPKVTTEIKPFNNLFTLR